MAFNTGLSGLRAANADLSVTGNNIANVGSAGFKQSRAEFADLYAASVHGLGSGPRGSGVQQPHIAQLFYQGNINDTQNPLDLAINGTITLGSVCKVIKPIAKAVCKRAY